MPFPARPRPPRQEIGMNDAHAEMNAARQVYGILRMLRPEARERTIEYVSKLLDIEERQNSQQRPGP